MSFRVLGSSKGWESVKVVQRLKCDQGSPSCISSPSRVKEPTGGWHSGKSSPPILQVAPPAMLRLMHSDHP